MKQPPRIATAAYVCIRKEASTPHTQWVLKVRLFSALAMASGFACNSGGNLFDEYISTLHSQPLICDLFTGCGENFPKHAAKQAGDGLSLFSGTDAKPSQTFALWCAYETK
jgi:hypothetical protein